MKKPKKDWITWVDGYADDNNISRYSVQANNYQLKSERIDWIFEGKKVEARRNDGEYSAYVVSMLALIKEAFASACGNNAVQMEAFSKAAVDFLNKYDQKYIDEKSLEFPYSETYKNADRKNGFANSEFEETILMLVEEAEFLAVKGGPLKEGEHFEKVNEIITAIYKAIHEPAMKKSIGMAAMLTAVVGITTEFFGDARGQSGGEFKNNNVYNQNRNAIQRLKYEMLNDYRDKMEASYDKARNIRNIKGAEALNNGTPYMLETFKEHIGAWLMQSKDGMTLTIMTGAGLDNRYGALRNEKFEDSLSCIEFPEGILLDKDTEFECITSEKAFKLKVEHFQRNGVGKYFSRLVGKGGVDNPFKLNAGNAPNGVAVFRRVVNAALKVPMHGHNYNQHYRVTTPVYNTYNTQLKNVKGQKLSIISE